MTAKFSNRNEEIVRQYEVEKLSLQEVGELHGISRERVRQILNEHGHREKRRRPNLTVTRRKAAWIDKHREEIAGRLISGEAAAHITETEAVPRSWVEAVWHGLTEEERRIATLRHVARTDYGTSEDDVTHALRWAAEQIGEPLTVETYGDWARTNGMMSPVTIITRCGTWVAGLKLAGLQANSSSNVPRRYSDEECLDAVRRVEKKVRRIPSRTDYIREALDTDPSFPLLRIRFDGWLGVLRALGKEI